MTRTPPASPSNCRSSISYASDCYVPDFIVRLAGGGHVILETKGFDEAAEIKAAAAERWCAAVNADGQFGRWDYVMARKVDQVRAALDAFAVARTP